jgi:very-short-patch-repair endonuclease
MKRKQKGKIGSAVGKFPSYGTAGASTACAAGAGLNPRQKAIRKAQRKALYARNQSNFRLLWRSICGPLLVEELQFNPDRKWRFDFAHPQTQTAIEIEGGARGRGKSRHTSFSGYANDCEKYNAAAMAGWFVIRLTPQQVTFKGLEQIAQMIRQRIKP